MITAAGKIFFLGGGSRARLVREAGNFVTVCEQIVKTMWDPRHLTTLQVSTVFHGDTCMF
jgi:hypothetical protein